MDPAQFLQPASSYNPTLARNWYEDDRYKAPREGSSVSIPVSVDNIIPAVSTVSATRPTYTTVFHHRGELGYAGVQSSTQQVIDLTSNIYDANLPGLSDPDQYIDAAQAAESIKALLEGAVEDEEDKQLVKSYKRRTKKNSDQLQKALSILSVCKSEDNAAESQDSVTQQPQDDSEDDEDDGTVEGLNVRLLPHQVEGVSWMKDKEVGKRKKNGILPKGGILADDVSS